MNLRYGKPTFVVYLLILLVSGGLYAQTDQKALEQKRNDLIKEINDIQQLLNKQGTEEKSLVTEMRDIKRKISVREQLNRVTNQQINLLSSKIKENRKSIAKLTEDLEVLKKNYAKSIKQSYKNRSQQNRLMFILSSESFKQAYKRMEYMRQYRNHIKKQGQTIQQKTQELNDLNVSLLAQVKEKEKLIQENRDVRNKLESEKQEQQQLIAQIQKKEKTYKAQLKDKQSEADRLEQEIDRLIKEAIAASNAKAGKANSTTFALTPEEKMIASSFEANKGKLIWPVERGVVSLGYGTYTDPVYPTIEQYNSGVNIATEEGATARAVFEGEVLNIMINNGKANVYIKHGNYITTYCNLAKLYVKKGDKVTRKQSLGVIFTNKHTGKTELKFLLYRNQTKQNPELWVYKM